MITSKPANGTLTQDKICCTLPAVDLASISFGSMPAWPAGGSRKGDFSGAS
jgi:hypothetical protein